MKGYVLAGGRSTRMGRDKALLDWRGQPLIVHAVELLRMAGLEPHIAGSRPDLAAFAPVVEDLHPACGPLGGIEAALAHCGGASALFVPVDLPLLPISFLRELLRRNWITAAPATIPTLAGQPQPLCAIYSSALVPGIRRALDAGDYKVMHALTQVAEELGEAVDLFSVEAVEAARTGCREQPVHRWFQNLNRPEDCDQNKSA